MGSMAASEVVDLLILVDATASMGSYLSSLKRSLPQIISIASLTNCFQRIGLLAYRDYCDKDLLEWSGWMAVDGSSAESVQLDLVDIASKISATGGGDYPEATKTGLAKAYEVMRADAKTLLLLYTDAPPHLKDGADTGMLTVTRTPCAKLRSAVPSTLRRKYKLSSVRSLAIKELQLIWRLPGYSNSQKEQEALLKHDSYGGCGPMFADWVSAAHALRNGEKKAQVMCILDESQKDANYPFLSHLTGGACMMLARSRSTARDVSELTIEMLMAWMGVKKEGAATTDVPVTLMSYLDPSGILEYQKEEDDLKGRYLPIQGSRNTVDMRWTRLASGTLEAVLPKKQTPIQNFANTYKESPRYRSVVTRHLRRMIENDVSSISLNPVFGSLWRTFCNDRDNDARQDLLNLFGLKVDELEDANERAKMKVWLEESYDYTAEILEAVERVPQTLRFPCVCLDPTLAFKTAGDAHDEDEDANKAITEFRRDELLEIGRSCDWRILRRLGTVLTRLTFIESAEAMPAHIAASDVTTIPMALASKEYGRRFWKILLHIVVPGTMLGGRSAALLAALAIRLGVQPLMHAAEAEMLLWKDKWNDLDIPETWNTSCHSLLLGADEAYVKNHGESLLLHKDRELFKRLVDYKMLELNLNTELHAKVGWTPQKAVIKGGGKFVVCKSCDYLRSVSVMGANGICGPCWCNVDRDPEAKPYDIHLGVEKNPEALPTTYWYECSMRECRGQYVVYDIDALNVRPKCHYCRRDEKAPLVECSKCQSRVIWPEQYRHGEDLAGFQCVGCQTGKNTIVQCTVTASKLREENAEDWLISNEDQKLKQAFNGRSLYHAASTSAPLDEFCEKVQILPLQGSEAPQLQLRGKPLHNSGEIIEQLYSWVFSRRTESGTCSLCFSKARKDSLSPACGRSGCQQKVCKECLEGWYGLNKAGRIINTAALHCPFCRRSPTSKTLTRSGQGVHTVARLAEAVAHSGEWIYAWCTGCYHAKQYMERVCAIGAPEGVEHFVCEACHAAKGGRVKIKPCPGCGVDTQKFSGCDHLLCTQCGTHWCFNCGEKQDEEDVYDHMMAAHGGYYHDREGWEDEERYYDGYDTDY